MSANAPQPPPALVPIVQPYADSSLPTLVEQNTRHIIRSIAGWLDQTSRHPDTGFLEAFTLRKTARRLMKEANRLLPPGGSHGEPS